MKDTYEFNFLIKLLFTNNKITVSELKSLDYEVLTKIASNQLVIPTLFLKLKSRKLLKHIPPEFNNYLQEIYKLNLNRNRTLIKEANEISILLNKKNIEHVFIKGTALVFDGIYDDISERMINDIDFLINKKDIQAVEEIFQKKDYFKKKDENFIFKRHLVRRINKKKLFALEPHVKLLESKEKLLNESNVLKFKLQKKIFIPNPIYNLIYNIYSFQINDNGSLLLNYNLRNFYDSFLLIKINNIKINNIEMNNEVSNYFNVLNDLNIKLFEFEKFKFNWLTRLRLKLRRKSNWFKKIDIKICLIIISYKILFKQFCSFILNKNYRLKKLNVILKFKRK
tara:strand:- start:7060 stop:8076 length:1017 start_codon:yes stop_codon:yes gene_type:complete